MTALVYILSASHSGSTLLTMLLAAHPEVATAGELKATHVDDISRYRCSCGRALVDCPFWQRVAARMRERATTWTLADFRTHFTVADGGLLDRIVRARVRNRAFEGLRDLLLAGSLRCRRMLSERLRNNAALIETIAELSGTKIVVDSSKLPNRLRFLTRIPRLPIKVVYLKRDGRGVALTYIEQHRMPMTLAAREWMNNHRGCEQMLRRLDPTSVCQVHYEDLCTRPDQTLDRLFQFIGVNPAEAASDYRAVDQHIIGNRMRLDTTSQIRLDETWKTVLNLVDLADFDRVAGALNARYGYPKGVQAIA